MHLDNYFPANICLKPISSLTSGDLFRRSFSSGFLGKWRRLTVKEIFSLQKSFSFSPPKIKFGRVPSLSTRLIEQNFSSESFKFSDPGNLSKMSSVRHRAIFSSLRYRRRRLKYSSSYSYWGTNSFEFFS